MNYRNLLGFIAYCCVYLCIQNMAMLTMFTAKLAGVNVGVIITIWSINPLFMALLDYLFFGQKLKYYHVIGTISIVICTIVISLSGVVLGSGEEEAEVAVAVVEPAIATWIPALFGVCTPIFFSINGVLTKSLTKESIGFDATNISFTAYLIVNILLLFGAIPYWSIAGF